jgi:tripartite ATP-independent transporter DctM subunit
VIDNPVSVAIVFLCALLVCVLAGIHIVITLSLLSFVGIFVLSGNNFTVAINVLGSTCFGGIKEYTFTVIPLFILMGNFMAHSKAAQDLFDTANHGVRKLPGGMAIATVMSNAVFAAVTGSSIASATVFSRISYPSMHSYKYSDGVALGSIAGSSVLGMLIPPSVLMIIYGMLAEVSIGSLFIAGIIPGLILAAIYSIGIYIMARINPAGCGRVQDTATGKWKNYSATEEDAGEDKAQIRMTILRSLPVFGIIIIVLGSIWGGVASPTEASALGAFFTFVLALARKMRLPGLKTVFSETAGTTATVMFLLITAKMYSRMLTMSGITVFVAHKVTESGMSMLAVALLLMVILLLLGCVLDSNSILLITVPLILPIATSFAWNPIWLGIIVIVIVECGLLTPPFGLVVFTMHATINRFANVSVESIFKGAMPFFGMMLLFVVILYLFPSLATWLPSLM